MATKKKKVVKRARNNKAPPSPKIEQDVERDRFGWITRTVDGLAQKQALFEQSQDLIKEYKKEVESLKDSNYYLGEKLAHLKKEALSFLSNEQIESAKLCGVTPEDYFFEWLRCCKRNEISFYNAPITISYTAIKDIR